ncbi:MAG TPA: molybdopterin-dependent oxidoreductase, partial [Candidatus Deferrimicrobiaceae bacterium]|nr:molybdopterin-dependent oxidoreductase [Candidatus Deferrimicrobiaceae bacterium]
MEEGKITNNKNGCFLSKAKFFNFNNEHRIKKPIVRKNGKLKEVSFEEAVQKSAEILANAKYPVLYGWSSTSCEAQKIGIKLAEQVGGVFDNTSSVCHGPSVLAMQEVGLPSCTLGQVRHRADLILYWGNDPLSSHPRHLQRYTYFSEGKYEKSQMKAPTSKITEEDQRKSVKDSHPQLETDSSDQLCLLKTWNKKPRRLLVVDVRKTLTAAIADFFIQIEPNKDFEIIQALRT